MSFGPNLTVDIRASRPMEPNGIPAAPLAAEQEQALMTVESCLDMANAGVKSTAATPKVIALESSTSTLAGGAPKWRPEPTPECTLSAVEETWEAVAERDSFKATAIHPLVFPSR